MVRISTDNEFMDAEMADEVEEDDLELPADLVSRVVWYNKLSVLEYWHVHTYLLHLGMGEGRCKVLYAVYLVY